MTSCRTNIDADAQIPNETTVVSIHDRGYVRTASDEESEPVLTRGCGAESFVLVPFGDEEAPDKEIPIHGHGAAGAVRFWGRMYLGEIEELLT